MLDRSEDAQLRGLLRLFSDRLPRGSRLAELLQPFLDSRRGSAIRALEPDLARVVARVLVDPRLPPPNGVRALLRPDIFAACERAFLACTALRVEYVSAAGERTTRRIEPHGLLFRTGDWWVVAFDHTRDAGRTFRMSRMRKVEALTTTFVAVDPRRLFERAD